jgi:hypothetical protein
MKRNFDLTSTEGSILSVKTFTCTMMVRSNATKTRLLRSREFGAIVLTHQSRERCTIV